MTETLALAFLLVGLAFALAGIIVSCGDHSDGSDEDY